MSNNEQEFTDFEVQVDLNNVNAWDGEARPALPIGDYKVKVLNVKNASSKEKQKPYIAVTFEVIEGELLGQKAYNNYMIDNETGLGRLKALMVATGCQLGRFVASELLGAELEITIEHNTSIGAPDGNGNPGKEKTFANVIKERAIAGSVQQAAPKAAPAAAQRPPVTQKATNGAQTRRA